MWRRQPRSPSNRCGRHYRERVQLQAAAGRVLLGGREPEPTELPPELGKALREWAEVAAAVTRVGAPADRDLVRVRGRQLAVRLAQHRGVSVDYVDPVTGAVEPVPFARPLPQALPEPRPQPRPRPRPRPQPRSEPRSEKRPDPPSRPDPEPAPEPTPWATGLTVTAFFAIIVTIADIALSRAFADAFGLLWLPVNLLIGAGLAPSLWLLRRTPFWRWPAYGVAVGLVVAWACLVVVLLAGDATLAGGG